MEKPPDYFEVYALCNELASAERERKELRAKAVRLRRRLADRPERWAQELVIYIDRARRGEYPVYPAAELSLLRPRVNEPGGPQ